MLSSEHKIFILKTYGSVQDFLLSKIAKRISQQELKKSSVQLNALLQSQFHDVQCDAVMVSSSC